MKKIILFSLFLPLYSIGFKIKKPEIFSQIKDQYRFNIETRYRKGLKPKRDDVSSRDFEALNNINKYRFEKFVKEEHYRGDRSNNKIESFSPQRFNDAVYRIRNIGSAFSAPFQVLSQKTLGTFKQEKEGQAKVRKEKQEELEKEKKWREEEPKRKQEEAERKQEEAKRKQEEAKRKQEEEAKKYTPYENLAILLKLPKNASESDIKKAYKKYIVENHPDKLMDKTPEEQTAALEKMQEINSLYNIIK